MPAASAKNLAESWRGAALAAVPVCGMAPYTPTRQAPSRFEPTHEPVATPDVEDLEFCGWSAVGADALQSSLRSLSSLEIDRSRHERMFTGRPRRLHTLPSKSTPAAQLDTTP